MPTETKKHPIIVNKEDLLRMLGGEWPSLYGYPDGYADSIDHFEVEDGLIIPYLGGAPMDAPSFQVLGIAKPAAFR